MSDSLFESSIEAGFLGSFAFDFSVFINGSLGFGFSVFLISTKGFSLTLGLSSLGLDNPSSPLILFWICNHRLLI